jgi:YspA, cpYpsA-related SLOG family
MKPVKLLVCGSRDYTDIDKVYHVLDAELARVGPALLIISGGARGADTIAHQWATDRKVDHLILYAKWEVEGKGAGPIRNRRMLRNKPKKVFAFHEDIDKSRGTRDMVKIAREAGVRVKVFS